MEICVTLEIVMKLGGKMPKEQVVKASGGA